MKWSRRSSLRCFIHKKAGSLATPSCDELNSTWKEGTKYCRVFFNEVHFPRIAASSHEETGTVALEEQKLNRDHTRTTRTETSLVEEKKKFE